MRRLRACIALALVVVAPGCADTAPSSVAAVPSDFADVLAADLAGDADSLSLVVAGHARDDRRNGLALRVYGHTEGRPWSGEPAVPARLHPDAQVSLAVHRGARCLGFHDLRGTAVLTCLRDGTWRPLPLAGLPASPAALVELTVSGGRLVAAFRLARRQGAQLSLLRLVGRRWRALGRPIPVGGAVAVVGEGSARRPAPEVAIADAARGRRTVWSFDRGDWHPLPPLVTGGAGPMPGGPVRVGARVYVPVVDASVEPWRLSVHVLGGGRWRALGEPLNVGRGSAQGVLRAADGEVWASWQQHAPRQDGRFDTVMFARRVAPSEGPPQRLWRGVTIGPGPIETVAGQGGLSVLYTPAAKGSAGLGVRVDPLRRGGSSARNPGAR